ncbi:MAG: uroporphyrinogen decarboxylase [Myxococcota bacterium]
MSEPVKPAKPVARLSARERFLRAARGQPVDRPPVWLMRQAGRYLPEYRELRAKTGFIEMCDRPDVAVEVSLQPHRRFGMDGVVVFSDILLPLRGAGLELDFSPGPVVARPVTSESELARLDGEITASIAPTCAAITRLRSELGDTAAVIGFAGAPWTLAAYATEAKLSRDLEVLSALSYREPRTLDRLLERMVEICAETLRLEIEAGADCVQIFDTWAGTLSAARFERFAGRALRAVIERLGPKRPPVIVFARGAAHLLDPLAGLGADVVSLDWRVDFAEAAAGVGQRVALQGNLDPTALFAPLPEIARETAALVRAGRKARGHIVNLGHGVLQRTPIEAVATFVRTVQESTP